MDLSYASIPNLEGHERTQEASSCRHGNQSRRVAQICFIEDDEQGCDDSIDFLGFGKIFYSIPVVGQPFSLPELSTSEESDYVDVVEEMGDSQEEKGKAPMFSASHAIPEQGSSSRERPRDIHKALLPLPVDDSQDPIPSANQTMKILIGTKEVDVGNLCEWLNLSITPQPVKPPNECIDKHVVHTPPLPMDL